MIRLILALTAMIIGAMLIFGTENEHRAVERVDTEGLADIAPAVVEPNPQAEMNVTREETLDLTSIEPTVASLAVDAAEEPVEPAASAITATPEPKILIVTGSRVNLREGPSTGRDIVGRLDLGDKAELLAEAEDGWLQIRHVGTGRVGFMSGQFLSPENPG